MIDKGKSSNRSYPEDFNLEAILKGIKDISKDHLTEAEKIALTELEAEIWFDNLEANVENQVLENKENQILKVFVDHIGNDPKTKAHFSGKNDINSEFLNLIKTDPKVQKDFKKLCDEFKDRSAAEIAERLPESNLFMKIMHYIIQNIFKGTLREQVKETKKSFVAALKKEKEQRNPGQGLST